MKQFIKYPSIKQFRNIISDIQHKVRYIGLNENNNPIYNDYELPKITAIATEKIHGTNSSVSYTNDEGIWVQSRNHIKNDGHMGCVKFVEENNVSWLCIVKDLIEEYDIDPSEEIISIYFEWCGGDIQRKSAVSGLDKRAILFPHFRISNIENPDQCKWLETKVKNKWIGFDDVEIYNIMTFKTYEIEIDFNKPFEAQNKMIEIISNLEQSSPVGEQFGISGNIGEGIVVHFKYQDTIYRFKVKGEKHSTSKVKTLNPVEIEEENKHIEFANEVAKPWRLEQMWKELVDETKPDKPDVKQIGNFLKLVFQNVIKEESDLIEKQELNQKKVNKYVAEISKKWYFEQLDKIVM